MSYSTFLHINQSFLDKNQSEKWTENGLLLSSSNSPKLKFCLSPSKEKKDLFVLKQKDIFMFYFSVSTNLIERLELHSFLVYLASSPDEG